MISYSCEALTSTKEVDEKGLEEEKTLKQLWIGVDIDGTLAKYEGWKGWDHIGDPIPETVKKVNTWLNKGIKVCIFTARTSEVSRARNNITFEQMKEVIDNWCEKNLGFKLPIKKEKDCWMLGAIDDSIVQMDKNTGIATAGDKAWTHLNSEIAKIEGKMYSVRHPYGAECATPDGKKIRLRMMFGSINHILNTFAKHITGSETGDIKKCVFSIGRRYYSECIGKITNAEYVEGKWTYDWIDGGPVE